MKNKEVVQSPPTKATEDANLDEIQGMHARAEHWLSDFEFYLEETTFLQKLLTRNFAQLFDHGKKGRAKALTDDLQSLDDQGRDIRTLIIHLLSDLKDQVVEPFPHELLRIRSSIGELEVRQTNFLKTFRSLKREVFTLAESAIESGAIRMASKQ